MLAARSPPEEHRGLRALNPPTAHRSEPPQQQYPTRGKGSVGCRHPFATQNGEPRSPGNRYSLRIRREKQREAFLCLPGARPTLFPLRMKRALVPLPCPAQPFPPRVQENEGPGGRRAQARASARPIRRPGASPTRKHRRFGKTRAIPEKPQQLTCHRSWFWL